MLAVKVMLLELHAPLAAAAALLVLVVLVELLQVMAVTAEMVQVHIHHGQQLLLQA
jgi:hypothetical protein